MEAAALQYEHYHKNMFKIMLYLIMSGAIIVHLSYNHAHARRFLLLTMLLLKTAQNCSVYAEMRFKQSHSKIKQIQF